MEVKTAPIKLGSEGYFGLAVYKADGTEVTEKRVSNTENVVTYTGAYSLFFGGGNADLLSPMYSQVGTGTTELTRASTGITNLLATTSTSSSVSRSGGNEVSNEDGTATLTAVRTNNFSLGAVVGTISEVGLITKSGNNFIAGQLIKDEFGSPTTLTLLADEQLVVTYTLVLTYPNGSGSFSQAAPVVGSGTVTTPSGTSDYTMYAQPFFNEYLGTEVATRTAGADSEYLFLSSTGEPSYGFGSYFSPSVTHDGTTGVSMNFSSKTVAPTDYISSDISFISAGVASTTSYYTRVEPTTKLSVSRDNSSSSALIVVEFVPALVKTSSDSMTVHMTMDFVI